MSLHNQNYRVYKQAIGDAPNVSVALGLLHPDYVDVYPDWVKVRDTIIGERAVKAKKTTYLPELCSVPDPQGVKYKEYLERAQYVPFAAHVLDGFVGTLFRRPVTVESTNSYDYDKLIFKQDFQIAARHCAQEIFALGRVGLFTDYIDRLSRARTFVIQAESILSWHVDEDTDQLDYVLILERKNPVFRISDMNGVGTSKLATESPEVLAALGIYQYRYRELRLTGGVYTVTLYDNNFEVIKRTTPLRNGAPLDFIPFVFIGSEDNSPEINYSPMLSIANLNIAHYRTSGLLETGRHYTAFPVYVVPVAPSHESTDQYLIAPSVVWEVPIESKPFVLEFYGQGLNHLAEALVEKERQLVQMGARLTGVRDISTKYEAPQIFQLMFQAELSKLLRITETMMIGLRTAIEHNLYMSSVAGNKDTWKIDVKISQEFRANNMASKDLRVVQLLHEKNLLPLPEVFRVFQNNDLISPDLSYREFELLIENARSEHDDDIAEQVYKLEKAKADAGVDAELEVIEAQGDVDSTLAEEEGKRASVEAEKAAKRQAAAAEKAAKSAERIAKSQPKIAPGVAGQPANKPAKNKASAPKK